MILEFSRPGVLLIRKLYEVYSDVVLPFVGRLLSGNAGAYKYLPASVKVFPSGERFLDELRQAGYEDLLWKPLTFGVVSLYRGRVPVP